MNKQVMFKSLSEALPEFGKRVLVLFEKSNHIEDATIEKDQDGDGWYYVLFDGECLKDSPTHWCDIPEIH